MADKLKGKVKFFNDQKGFGFIVREDGEKDVFVHKTAVVSRSVLQEGDRVEFDVQKGKKGLEAANVTVI